VTDPRAEAPAEPTPADATAAGDATGAGDATSPGVGTGSGPGDGDSVAQTDGAARRRPSRRQLLIAAGVLVVLLAAGVGYALTRSVEPGYGSPEAISELLAERGAPCEDFDSDGEGRADKRGTCYVDGERVIIATFGSRAEVEAHWERQLATAADNDVIGMVIGDKWTVSSTARAYLRHAAEVLHAEYRNN
jgi:hypothetical protein